MTLVDAAMTATWKGPATMLRALFNWFKNFSSPTKLIVMFSAPVVVLVGRLEPWPVLGRWRDIGIVFLACVLTAAFHFASIGRESLAGINARLLVATTVGAWIWAGTDLIFVDQISRVLAYLWAISFLFWTWRLYRQGSK